MDEVFHRSPADGGGPVIKLRMLRWNLQYITVLMVLSAIAIGVVFGLPMTLLGLPAVALVLLQIDGITRPGSQLFYPAITHGSRSSGLVALTFDDGPDPKVTPEILRLLREHRAHATFFVIGKWLDAHPELGRLIVEQGHVLANHSWSHSRLQNFYLNRKHAFEIEKCQQLIHKLGGVSPVMFRPPIGLKSCELAKAAYRQNVILVAWSLHSRDSRLRSPEKIANRVLERIRAGDIVLLHDGHDLPGRHRRHCVQALRLILQGLQDKGLRCTTVPDLLRIQGADVAGR